MGKTKAASLAATVITTKGAAAPSAEKATNPAKDDGERISVTVRLSTSEYRKLKMHGLERRQSNQDIIVAALDAYLSNEVNE